MMRHPADGISGYWCWIAEGYPVARIVYVHRPEPEMATH